MCLEEISHHSDAKWLFIYGCYKRHTAGSQLVVLAFAVFIFMLNLPYELMKTG